MQLNKSITHKGIKGCFISRNYEILSVMAKLIKKFVYKELF